MVDQKKESPKKKPTDEEIEQRKQEILKKRKNGLKYRDRSVSTDELVKS